MKAKFYEFLCSGSYYNSGKDVIDFEGVKVLVPKTALEEVAVMHMQSRYLPNALKSDKRYTERVHKIRQIHVDDMKEVEGELSYVGKDLKELSDVELQDLATVLDLRRIPLPARQSGMSLRDMRVIAYMTFADKIQGKVMKQEDVAAEFAKLPAIKLTADGRTEKAEKLTNEEIIAQEQKTTATEDDPRKRFTLKELKDLAKQKNVTYDGSMADDVLFDALYKKLYT